MAAGGPARTDLATALLRVESLAARLEAHTTADRALGRLWRAEAGLTEAVRSVGLEDVHIREGDLVAKFAENRVTGPDGQGIAAAHDVLRGLQAPGDLVKRPAETLARLGQVGAGGDAARLHRLVASDAEPPASAGAADGADGQGAAADAKLLDGIAADLAAGPGTVLPALRIAGRVGGAMPPRHPIVERLAFVVADHALRRAAAARSEMSTRDRTRAEEDPLAGIGAGGQGAWVLLPATALSTDGFRAWAPRSQQGVRDLLDGLGTALGRELGRLGELRYWTEVTVPRFTGGPRRGGRRDLVAYLLRQPLVTAPMVAAALDVTGQTARNLIAAAEAAGVVVQVTRRDRHRVWATPGLAERLAARTSARHRDAIQTEVPRTEGELAPLNRLAELEGGRSEGAFDAVMADIGDAMVELDAVLDPSQQD